MSHRLSTGIIHARKRKKKSGREGHELDIKGDELVMTGWWGDGCAVFERVSVVLPS